MASVPRRAPAQARPGERTGTGHIGLGPRGYALLQRLRGQAVAVCDVDTDRLARGAAVVGAGVRAYKDYRELLDQSDVTAVVIATPDHWHAIQAIHACEAGKDVYIETPVCCSPLEGRELARAARWYGGVVQAGGEACFSAAAGALKARLDNGAVGKVRRISCWGDANPTGGNTALDGIAPARLDWDKWVGPAPWIPYNPDVFSGWRWMTDFGRGNLCSQGAELLALAAWLAGVPDSGTVTASAQGPKPGAGNLWDCPPTLDATLTFDAADLSIAWRQPGDETGAGMLLEGESGSLRMIWQEGWTLEGEAATGLKEEPIDAWHRAVNERSQPSIDIGIHAQAASLAHLAHLAWRLERPLTWAMTACSFVGDEQADRMVRAAGRGHYRL